MPCFAYVGAEDNRKGIPFVKIVSLLCKLIQFLMVALSVTVHKALILLVFLNHPYQSLAFPGFLEIIRVVVIKERNISYMYDLHATLKMEGGKMRLELVVECAYDDGNKQASMNLTTPPDQHDNIYTDARHYGDDEFDAVYDEDEEENLPF